MRISRKNPGCSLSAVESALTQLSVQKPGLLDKVYPAYRKAIAFSLDHKAGVLLLSLVLLVTWLYKLTVNSRDYSYAATIGILVFIICSPVGAYYEAGLAPVKIYVEQNYMLVLPIILDGILGIEPRSIKHLIYIVVIPLL